MIQLPPSKSIGARFMVATFFAGTLPADPVFDDNDDLLLLQQALLEVYSDEEPIDYGDSLLDVGASGTAMRFVTAVCASSPGADYIITGTERLMSRPMKPLVDLLKEAGADVQPLGENGCGPYRVVGKNLKGGEFSIRGDVSSQFISAVMLAAPTWENGVKLNFTTPLVSSPYVEMTANLMRKFDLKLELTDKGVEVKPGKYKEPSDFTVEADWSSASFFYEACALGASDLQIAHLVSPEISLQGDAAASNIFKHLGVETKFGKESAVLTKVSVSSSKIELDFKDFPDLVLPYALACLCEGMPFSFTGVSHLRLKESDRLEALCNESRKIGFVVTAKEDRVEWNGEKCEAAPSPVIETYEDHRVAMAFAVSTLKLGEIRIANPEVVKKSFIDFWNQISNIGLSCNEADNIMTVRK